MTLKDIPWNPVYESRFDSDESLMDAFYRPFLQEAVRYDRLAGYLSLQSLSNALDGVDSLLETDGTVRVIAGGDLRQREKGFIFPDSDEPLAPWIESQLAIIATLFDEGRLKIKIGQPKSGEGLFHPKLGIAVDNEDNRVTFEGSINETLSAWHRNYERFKVHRSWANEESKFVDEDVSTFNRLWNDFHPSVDIHELDEAIEKEIIDWKPDDEEELYQHVERVRESNSETLLSEDAVAEVLSTAGRDPGGLHLAEDVSPVDPWPHQRVISDTAVSIYPNNLLFCDEVGLGKTIEAGLTLSRLVHTGKVDNALLLVPAGLIQQWQEELLGRFNLHAYYHDRQAGVDYLIDPYGEPHRLDGTLDSDEWENTPLGGFVSERDEPSIIITSWHTARRSDNRGLVVPSDGTSVWGATVVDEAHSAREGTNFYDLLTRVEETSECLYALTATPMQLKVGELYDLLRLCNLPSSWDNKTRFSHFFETRSALMASLEDVGDNHPSAGIGRRHVLQDLQNRLEIGPDKARERVAQFAELIHEHITEHPGYESQTKEAIDSAGITGLSEKRTLRKLLGVDTMTMTFDDPREFVFDCDLAGWRVLVEVSEWATPVQTRIFRNTRSVLRKCQELDLLDATVPKRDVETKRIPLGNAEDLYERVESYITEVYKKSQQELTGKEKLALGFVMTTYRQRLTSSLYAIQQSLLRRYNKLHGQLQEQGEDLTDDIALLAADPGDVSEATLNAVISGNFDAYRPDSGSGQSIIETELSELASFIGTLEQTPSDPKLGQLKKDIKGLRREARDNIIIFTQYEDTLKSIRSELVKTHPNVGTYTGSGGSQYDHERSEWKNVGKETIKTDFTSDEGKTNILVCTDSASEGLNLQTGDALINYDLPWNPMRVEQRIGRIDRIGQRNHVVKIVNYGYEDSIDGDIYESLEERLNLFEDVVGTMRPVLSGLEGDISSAVMGGGSSGADSVDDKMTNTVERKNEDARAAAEQAGLVDQSAHATTENELVEETRLDGWGSVSHPAIYEIGKDNRRYESLVDPELIETLLTQSTTLNEAGWSFTALRRHEEAESYPGAADDAYVLHPPATEDGFSTPETGGATAQTRLSDGEGLVVTFIPAMADEFPSIRLLLPGDPLFQHLRDIAQEDMRRSLNIIYGGLSENGKPEIWINSGSKQSSLVCLPAVADETVIRDLPSGGKLSQRNEAEALVREWCLLISESTENLP